MPRGRTSASGPGRLRVGTSGWQYDHWRGDFYPADLPKSRWFEHYASVFDTVEINNSFYRLPSAEAFTRWRAAAPRGFVYAVKISRYLTHLKHLHDPHAPLALFLDHAHHLGTTFGPVLVQLPPRWHADVPRLAAFLRALPRTRSWRWALEVRQESWLCAEVIELLAAHGVALVWHDARTIVVPRVATASFRYLRFHGTTPSGAYGTRRLREPARVVARELADGTDVYAYFNNDTGGHAPRDAILFAKLVAEEARHIGASLKYGFTLPRGP
jgi:uncharacterized protein YecE (DUF72 family)